MKKQNNKLGVPRRKNVGSRVARVPSPKKATPSGRSTRSRARAQSERRLIVRWGKRQQDMMYVYSHHEDGSLAHYHLGTERHSAMPLPHGAWNPSFLKELEKRGYDLTTFRLSVKGFPALGIGAKPKAARSRAVAKRSGAKPGRSAAKATPNKKKLTR